MEVIVNRVRFEYQENVCPTTQGQSLRGWGYPFFDREVPLLIIITKRPIHRSDMISKRISSVQRRGGEFFGANWAFRLGINCRFSILDSTVSLHLEGGRAAESWRLNESWPFRWTLNIFSRPVIHVVPPARASLNLTSWSSFAHRRRPISKTEINLLILTSWIS